jgi:glycosyltransferase involved in cell wall biosynthesis
MRLSIVTATKNSANQIGCLIDDLNSQTDSNFKWIVVDGLSIDETIDIIKKNALIDYEITSEKDSGIYDALNKAIVNKVDDFYLVIGSDDRLSANAVKDINSIINDLNPDLIVNSIEIGDRKVQAFFGSPFSFLGADRIVTGHSVGMVIKKKLHEKLGLYRTDLTLASDAHFIYKIYGFKCNVALNKAFIGKFTIFGSSNKNRFKQICETYTVQREFSRSSIIPLFLLLLRLLKNWRVI